MRGATITGRRIHGRLRRARSRSAATATRIDSVPPEVSAPTVDGGPWNSAAAAWVTSASMRRRLWKAIGLSRLPLAYMAWARSSRRACSSPAW